MQRVRNASSLMPFVEESSSREAWCTPTAGWASRTAGIPASHRLSVGPPQAGLGIIAEGAEAISLLKRWLLGTHQGAVSHEHLDYYLDEFVFRFNRRSSRSRGKLFYRLVQQAVAVDPTPYRSIVADWDAEAP